LDLGVLNVLIIPDKFKGTLTAGAAAEAIARGWRKVRPLDTLNLVPMSDGGDGFGEVLGRLLHAEERQVEALDAAHRQCQARWWFDSRSRTALIDSAGVIGLAMLPSGKFHPFDLDTYGLGLVIKAAAESGTERCLVGIGGSATNDAGFGMARALGWEFLSSHGPIERWTDLTSLKRLAPPKPREVFTTCNVAVDVQNRLLGPQGATRIYGPQKGMRPQDFESAEQALEALAKVVRQELGQDYHEVPGSGAAGGLGFGFLAFLGGRLEGGFDLFAAQADLELRLKSADLVITGEGAIDQSTVMGKGVGRVGQWCGKLGIPCIRLAGQVTLECAAGNAFTQSHSLTEVTSLESAKGEPAYWLEHLAGVVASKII
jgi:glycerate kinase